MVRKHKLKSTSVKYNFQSVASIYSIKEYYKAFDTMKRHFSECCHTVL